MELQALKQKISEAGFSEEVGKKLDEILSMAIAKGSLSAEDKAKMMELIDIDIESGNLEADAMENMAVILDSFANEAENLGKTADIEEEKIASDADLDAKKLENELAQLKTSGQPVQPVPQWGQSVVPRPVAPVTPAATQQASLSGTQTGQ